VSDVGCNCAAGVTLVDLNDERCNQDDYDITSPPQCSKVDIMKANQEGF